VTDYVRLSLGLEWSEASDYSSPLLRPPAIVDELSGDLEVMQYLIEAHTTAVTVELGAWTTIHYVIVDNRSSTVDVCATFTNVGGHVATAAATSHDVAAGRFAVLTDVNPANDITFDSESSTTHRTIVYVIGT
jgi:hypothetical protein